VIDALISFLLYILLLFTVGNSVIKSISSSDIEIANSYYAAVCEEKNIPYEKEDQYGLYIIDFDKYFDQQIANGLNSEEAYGKYNEADQEVIASLEKIPEYLDAYNTFYLNYNFVLIICMFVSLFIFQLIIPLLNKKHQTIAMLIFKSAIANKKDGVLISKANVILRFFLIFITEFATVYIILNWFGLIFLVLITFFSISMTKTKATLHDLILKTEVKKAQYIYTE
jgi:hypothetical protein